MVVKISQNTQQTIFIVIIIIWQLNSFKKVLYQEQGDKASI